MTCTSKKVPFKTKAEAQKAGMKVYKCRYCYFWHRTGKVSQIANPVIKAGVLCAALFLIGCDKAEPLGFVACYDRLTKQGMAHNNAWDACGGSVSSEARRYELVPDYRYQARDAKDLTQSSFHYRHMNCQ